MMALFCSYFASGFGFQFFVTWLPTYFMREHGLTLQRSGVFAALPLGGRRGRMPVGRRDRRLDHAPLGKRNNRASHVGVGGFLIGSDRICGR